MCCYDCLRTPTGTRTAPICCASRRGETDTVLTNLKRSSGLFHAPDRIAELRGLPCPLVSTNGTELTSNAALKWQENRKVDWRYILSGQRTQDGLVEDFNGRMREDCFDLNTNLKLSFGAQSV